MLKSVSAFAFAKFVLPIILEICDLKIFVKSHVKNSVLSAGIESAFLLSKETKTGRVSRLSVKKALDNSFNAFIRSQNFGLVENVRMIDETCQNVLSKGFTLENYFASYVRKEKDLDAVLIFRSNDDIKRAKANFSKQIVTPYLALFGLTENPKFKTMQFTDGELLNFVLWQAKNNLSTKRFVKVIKATKTDKTEAIGETITPKSMTQNA